MCELVPLPSTRDENCLGMDRVLTDVANVTAVERRKTFSAALKARLIAKGMGAPRRGLVGRVQDACIEPSTIQRSTGPQTARSVEYTAFTAMITPSPRGVPLATLMGIRERKKLDSQF